MFIDNGKLHGFSKLNALLAMGIISEQDSAYLRDGGVQNFDLSDIFLITNRRVSLTDAHSLLAQLRQQT